jgi:hypothetical protein
MAPAPKPGDSHLTHKIQMWVTLGPYLPRKYSNLSFNHINFSHLQLRGVSFSNNGLKNNVVNIKTFLPSFDNG